MSSTAARSRPRPPRGARARHRRRSTRRRWLVALAAGAALIALAVTLLPLEKAVRELTLPLRHEDIIRQQARAKDLDPSLVAAIIYEESRFRDQTSRAGARGLMQITPQTARFIARVSGGTRFVPDDLDSPQINISYGTYYLRYLIHRYRGNQTLAVAAYNAGHANVDGWVRRAGGPENFNGVDDIPFPETREYVKGVFEHRKEYRKHYARELGL